MELPTCPATRSATSDMNFIRSLFSVQGLLIALYLFIGVAVNTASPHVPHLQNSASATAELHSWVQYITSVFFWPFSFWSPTITVGKWTGV
jgi:hypothetical protein